MNFLFGRLLFWLVSLTQSYHEIIMEVFLEKDICWLRLWKYSWRDTCWRNPDWEFKPSPEKDMINPDLKCKSSPMKENIPHLKITSKKQSYMILFFNNTFHSGRFIYWPSFPLDSCLKRAQAGEGGIGHILIIMWWFQTESDWRTQDRMDTEAKAKQILKIIDH